MAAFRQYAFKNENKNSDLLIYDGFMSNADEEKAKTFREDLSKGIFSKSIMENVFSSDKTHDLARKVIYRNFADKIILDPNLNSYYFSFLKRSHDVIKNGFDPSYNYSEQETKNDNFMKNDKMVEFTLSEMRSVLPELTEKHKENPEKSKIIEDFRASLNELIAEYKEKNNVLTNTIQPEKKEDRVDKKKGLRP